MTGWLRKKTKSAEDDLLAQQGQTGVGLRRALPSQTATDPAVYFITTIGAPFLKIGTLLRASSLQQRLALVQTGCPYAVRLAMIMYGAGRREEARLHKLFDPHRARAEWFRVEGPIAEVVEAARSDHEKAISELWMKIRY